MNDASKGAASYTFTIEYGLPERSSASEQATVNRIERPTDQEVRRRHVGSQHNSESYPKGASRRSIRAVEGIPSR